jgi:hypothetical protein
MKRLPHPPTAIFAALVLVGPIGACDATVGSLELQVGGTGMTEKGLELELRGVILRDDAGEPWTVRDVPEVHEIEGAARTSIGRAPVPVGDYEQIKVELGPVFVITMEDGSTLRREWPDILMYIRDGEYLHATEENGFERTNRYFVFSVDNGALEAPLEIEGAGGAAVATLLLEPRYPEIDSVGSRAALAAQLVLER